MDWMNQRPLFVCCNCHEDYTWLADDLRVHENETWCDNCWNDGDYAYGDAPISWHDLPTFKPAVEDEIERLRTGLHRILTLAGYLPVSYAKEIAGETLQPPQQEEG